MSDQVDLPRGSQLPRIFVHSIKNQAKINMALMGESTQNRRKNQNLRGEPLAIYIKREPITQRRIPKNERKLSYKISSFRPRNYTSGRKPDIFLRESRDMKSACSVNIEMYRRTGAVDIEFMRQADGRRFKLIKLPADCIAVDCVSPLACPSSAYGNQLPCQPPLLLMMPLSLTMFGNLDQFPALWTYHTGRLTDRWLSSSQPSHGRIFFFFFYLPKNVVRDDHVNKAIH